jgi:HD superfamily phosphohydrolase YqeK
MIAMIDVDEREFHRDIEDLLLLPELASSRGRAHHFDLSEFEHLLAVARRAHGLSRVLGADARVCARAGLLHDLGAHWFNTVAPCALAAELEEPAEVRHAIRAHTLVPELPRTREAWVVIVADLLTSAQECGFVIGRARRRAGRRLHEELAARRRLLATLARRRAERLQRLRRLGRTAKERRAA